MSADTLETIVRWLGLIVMGLGVIGGVGLFTVAIYQSLKSRAVRWDALIFAGFLLWVLPYGIRNYGPVLTDATIDLLHSQADRRPAMEDAIRSFIGNEGQDAGDPVVTVPDAATPQFTATPQQTPEINFQATTDAFMHPLPAATSTPYPDYAATIQAQVTPTPTVFVCQQSSDFARGCLPPTPVPGG